MTELHKQCGYQLCLHSDASDGAHPRTHTSPLIEPPVFTRAHQVLAAPVMGMLVEDPVAFLHIAGVDVVVVEALIQGGAVVSQLHHLASELRALINHHSVRTLVLWKRFVIY